MPRANGVCWRSATGQDEERLRLATSSNRVSTVHPRLGPNRLGPCQGPALLPVSRPGGDRPTIRSASPSVNDIHLGWPQPLPYLLGYRESEACTCGKARGIQTSTPPPPPPPLLRQEIRKSGGQPSALPPRATHRTRRNRFRCAAKAYKGARRGPG
jgi:hypothetical protein